MSGSDALVQIAGALLSFVLIVAVLMLLLCAIIWAVASSTGNIPAAVKARTGLVVAVGASCLAGAGVAWVNWLIDLGSTL